jgi:hypothetical protein
VVFFLLEVDVVFPLFFNGGVNRVNLSLYSYLGHGFIGVMLGMVAHFPVVVHQVLRQGSYALWLFAPVLGLSLLGSAGVPAMLSLFILNSLSQFGAEQSIADQYQVILAGWMFLALVEALSRFRNKRPLLVGIAACTALFETMYFGAILLPQLSIINPALPDVRAAVRTLPAHAVVWTQNRLGVWVYRRRFIGIDREQVPRLYVSPLPRLWQEAGALDGSHTAILGMQPVTPFFADVVARALRAGYRISFHQGPVFVLVGTRHFHVPRPNLNAAAWQPSGPSWVIPAWTQVSEVTRIAWRKEWVIVPQGRQGLVFPGFEMVLEPGRYSLSVDIRDATHSSGAILGYLKAAGHEVAIRAGTALTTLHLILTRRELVYLSLTTTGRAAFSVLQFHVDRVVARADSGSAP